MPSRCVWDNDSTGRLPQATDVDVYRFSLQATDHVLMHLDPPPDGGVAFQLLTGDTPIATESGPATGAPIVYDAMLPPGDYQLWLTHRDTQPQAVHPGARPRRPVHDLRRPGTERRDVVGRPDAGIPGGLRQRHALYR